MLLHAGDAERTDRLLPAAAPAVSAAVFDDYTGALQPCLVPSPLALCGAARSRTAADPRVLFAGGRTLH